MAVFGVSLRNVIRFTSVLCLPLFVLLYFTNATSEVKETHNHAYDLPKQISFAGENVPLDNKLVFESFDREVIINTYWHSRTLQVIKRANKFFPIIEPILDSLDVPKDFKYLAVIESGLMNVTSPAGAKGIWQFLEGTAKEYGMEVNSSVDERLHLEKSTIAACEYLKSSYELFGTWSLAAASYNMGVKGVKRSLEKQGKVSYFDLHLNEETGRYIYRIVATKFIFENAKNIGFEWNGMEKYSFPSFKTISISDTTLDLYGFCSDNDVLYKDLKAYNPWLRSDKLITKAGKTYVLKLPE